MALLIAPEASAFDLVALDLRVRSCASNLCEYRGIDVHRDGFIIWVAPMVSMSIGASSIRVMVCCWLYPRIFGFLLFIVVFVFGDLLLLGLGCVDVLLHGVAVSIALVNGSSELGGESRNE